MTPERIDQLKEYAAEVQEGVILSHKNANGEKLPPAAKEFWKLSESIYELILAYESLCAEYELVRRTNLQLLEYNMKLQEQLGGSY